MFFFGVTIENDQIARLFDLASMVLDPANTRATHITLRGPYDRKPRQDLNWRKANVGTATLSKPENFFEYGQSTVYLRCEIPFITDIWHKPDYPNGVPHLTIYDGGDRVFAWQIFQTLQRHEWKLELLLSKMKIIDTKEVLETNYIKNSESIDKSLSEVSSEQYSMENLKNLHQGQRIFLLDKICKRIHFITHPSSALI